MKALAKFGVKSEEHLRKLNKDDWTSLEDKYGMLAMDCRLVQDALQVAAPRA